MAQSTDYAQDYKRAENAYFHGNYEEASEIADRLSQEHGDDPSIQLLRGHIYCYGLHQYDLAQEQYELVLQLTDERDFVDYANNGIKDANQFRSELEGGAVEEQSYEAYEPETSELIDELSAEERYQDLEGFSDYQDFPEADDPELTHFSLGDDAPAEESIPDPNLADWTSDEPDNPFASDLGSENGSDTFDAASDPFADALESNPFALEGGGESEEWNESADFSDSPFGEYSPFPNEESSASEMEVRDEETFMMPGNGEIDDPFPANSENDWLNEEDDVFGSENGNVFDDPSDPFDSSVGQEFLNEANGDSLAGEVDDNAYGLEDFSSEMDDFEPDTLEIQDETLLMPSGVGDNSIGSVPTDQFDPPNDEEDVETRLMDAGEARSFTDDFDETSFTNGSAAEDYSLEDYSGPLDASEFENGSSYGALEDDTIAKYAGNTDDFGNTDGFLENFDVFNDELDSIPDEEEPELDSELGFKETGGLSDTDLGFATNSEAIASDDDSMFSLSGATASVSSANFTSTADRAIEPTAEVEQGVLAGFENAPLPKKQFLTACAAGIAGAIAVAVLSFATTATTPAEQKAALVPRMRVAGLLMSLAAGAGSFGATLFLGKATAKQISRATNDLQSQFEAVSQGNLNAKATVFSEDEFGQLAAGFNEMARVILTTTSEAQRRAEETEQQKEDLQRQVIRLLDDVEGAARGDLTVRAEVTADVLGAVADAFNLTIQNLREIVQQVKDAARQVNKTSGDNEQFARGLQQDALRQAEELAVTLNSVQMMTDSIRRVADNAKEAEDVARSAADVAIKGGESVEHTVSGILQIRETVAETARKVKRLAEASQEISKIVAAIAQIASRTNLLALNASIEAARAGEAGRGFAIVADEVRQLADKSAKALKEIEQNVLQIQGETSSVMAAMEEGVTQVIDVTRRAEQAKRSLEDIIQVSNRIDALVRSITADTVEQTESTFAVAQVMQSVELTAQETSQESQRVSASLQSQVSIARSLLASVERFRVDTTENG